MAPEEEQELKMLYIAVSLSPLVFYKLLEKAVRLAKIALAIFTQTEPELLFTFTEDIDIIEINIVKIIEHFVRP